MSRDKNKNKYGTFSAKKNSAYSKKKQWFWYAILLLVFVSGGGIAVYKKLNNKPVELAQVQAEESSLPGWWLSEYFGESVCETKHCLEDGDPDNDKLTNAQEFYYKTDPLKAHTVNDELNDGELVARGFDPSREGRKTFEQALAEIMSDEQLLNESLVFETDIRTMYAESMDFSKIDLPLVSTSDLEFTDESSPEVYMRYFNDLKFLTEKYFSDEDAAAALEAMEIGSTFEIESIRLKSSMLADDLKEVIVPVDLENFHKYLIALYQLIPDVLTVPGLDTSIPNTQTAMDKWYDKAQTFIAVQQKLAYEKETISRILNK